MRRADTAASLLNGPRQHTQDPQRRSTASTAASNIAVPLLMVGLAYVGFFKGSRWASTFPIDLTLALAALTCISIAFVVVSRGARIKCSLGGVTFVAACLPAMLYANENPHAYDKRLSLLIPLILAVGTAMLVRGQRRQEVWVWLHVAVGLLVVASHRTSRRDLVSLFSADGSNTIATGQACGVAVVVLLLMLFGGGIPHWWMKLTAFAVSIWLTSALIATGSRGPVIACATTILIVAAVSHGRRRVIRLAAAIIAIAGGWLMLAAATGIGAHRITESFASENALAGTRQTMWLATLDAIPQHPLGVGWGNLYSVLPPWAVLDSGYNQYPHNVVLEIFIEAGWIAGVLAIVVLAATFRRLIKFADHPIGMSLLGITIFVTLNAMVSGDINDNRMLWAAVAMAWVVQKRQ